ncbi:hypothetical protein [Frigoriglobus tundricola]|uniref:Uncharacterized protein n=1 Tax=Frigoriglobus tundricola TaxID=2774151 RepID=A0A6M5YS37_9BACT|nr:hypothetical protein [Frigoriglobus tundricola]QJW96865.1 hypothetical protein FTUN_4425 [Frigoriglobus tundricola]
MTEAEWLACDDPERMFPNRREVTDERKMRLFGCACCGRIWSLLPNESRDALGVAERYADGLATRADRDRAFSQAEAVAFDRGQPWAPDPATFATHAAADAIFVRSVTGRTASSVSSTAASAAACAEADKGPDSEYDTAFENAHRKELAEQAKLIRDIFGNPFRPVTLEPLWLTFDVQALARGIYDNKAFDRMPILADALQDAGCDNTDVLGHCRGAEPHVRGCWVVDMLLEKA